MRPRQSRGRVSLVLAETEAVAEVEARYRTSGYCPRYWPRTGLGLGPPVLGLSLNSVDREQILGIRLAYGSSLYMALWANTGGLPLVGCLDTKLDRVET